MWVFSHHGGSLYRQRPLYNCSSLLVGFFWHMYCPSSEWDSRRGNELSSSSFQHKCDRSSACRILLIESIWRVELVCMRIEKRVNKARSIGGNPNCKKRLFDTFTVLCMIAIELTASCNNNIFRLYASDIDIMFDVWERINSDANGLLSICVFHATWCQTLGKDFTRIDRWDLGHSGDVCSLLRPLQS